jgi:hypothetical protein
MCPNNTVSSVYRYSHLSEHVYWILPSRMKFYFPCLDNVCIGHLCREFDLAYYFSRIPKIRAGANLMQLEFKSRLISENACSSFIAEHFIFPLPIFTPTTIPHKRGWNRRTYKLHKKRLVICTLREMLLG